MSFRPRKIVSGGQTGVDRAALDFALKNGFEIGGWVPKGRIAEDGIIDLVYPNLKETTTQNYSERTKLNILDSDATLILSQTDLTGGTALTKELAKNYKKPLFLVDFRLKSNDNAVYEAKRWLQTINCNTLNIAQGHQKMVRSTQKP